MYASYALGVWYTADMTTTRPNVHFRDISVSETEDLTRSNVSGTQSFSSLQGEQDRQSIENYESAGWVIAGLGVFVFMAVVVGQALFKK